ncbi:DMT family transporter [Achromobacter denitrificans]|uniref:DMT family transporter n=1 Tax=Achromobacter denitrificans TaxID=32002 RepID=UPI003CFFFFE8
MSTLSSDALPADARPGISWAPIAAFCPLWSSAFAAAKIAVRDCPPLTLLTIRFLIAGALMLALAAASGRWKLPAGRDLAALVLLGVLNNSLYLGLSWSGMTTVSSAFTAVLISTNPLLIGVLAGPVLGERLGWRKLAGLCLGLAGVALVLRSRLSGMQEDLHGTLLVTGGLVALVAGTLLYKRLKPSSGLWTSTGIQSLAGAVALLPFALANESLGDARMTASLFWSMAYMIVAVSMGGYYLWFMILGRASATSASALHFLMPPLGLLFGWLVLGEAVSWLDLLGIVPIAFGIWLATRRTA